MNAEDFLAHHSIDENPFGAEEARHDPIYTRLLDSTTSHPDFAKILGRIDQPRTAVVFGEKGSGKTAIRMLITNQVIEHNTAHPDRRALLIVYDDLNPVLDRVMVHRRGEMGFRLTSRTSPEKLLDMVRLEDHQDAILSLAVTKLVDGILGTTDGSGGDAMPMPDAHLKVIKKWPRQLRADLAVLTALYDQPRNGAVAQRWHSLLSRLRMGSWLPQMALLKLAGTLTAIAAVVLAISGYWIDPRPFWLTPLTGLCAAASIVLWCTWAWHHISLWMLCRKIQRETVALQRSPNELRSMLLSLRKTDLANRPWPVPGKIPGGRGIPGNQDSRYQFISRLLAVLKALDYVGIMVLIDRVDEPTSICGNPQRMRSVVWPMLDNKFLQQDTVGIKLLLPIELRHLLHRESADFFQEARLDKQNMIDRLTWSGATLYDLCNARLRACRSENPEQIQLTSLFDPDVTRDMLIEALDQMHQPRDAFKFLYAVIQEHCRTTTQDHAVYRIPRLTLEAIRRQQSQRVQELYRGLAPA